MLAGKLKRQHKREQCEAKRYEKISSPLTTIDEIYGVDDHSILGEDTQDSDSYVDVSPKTPRRQEHLPLYLMT